MSKALKKETYSFEPGSLGFQGVLSSRTKGYRTSTAITDIVDNSIDAGAKNVSITTLGKSTEITSIIIMDDGSGMSYDELDGSYQIGCARPRRKSELGKFGMGGTYASLALASKKTTVTIGSEGVLARMYDLGVIEEHDAWGSIPHEPLQELVEELQAFNKSSTGTLIKLQGLELMRNRRKDALEVSLHKAIGKAYCDAIENGSVEFKINGEVVKPYDPLCWSHVDVKKKFPTTGESELVFPEEPVGSALRSLRMRIVSLKDVPDSVKGASDKNQGVYVYRCGRLIKSAITNCDWWNASWTSDPRYRDCRVGLYFDSSLDEQFGITHLKDSVDPQQSFGDKIRAKILPFAKSIRDARIEAERNNTKEGRKVTAENVTDTLNDIIDTNQTKKPTITKKVKNGDKTIIIDSNVVLLPNTAVLDNYDYHIVEEQIGAGAPFARLHRNPEEEKCYIKINTEHPFISRYHVHGDVLTQQCLSIMINAIMRSKDIHENTESSDDLYSNFDNYLRLLAKKVD